jgi:nicotinamide-nucleotide amidase
VSVERIETAEILAIGTELLLGELVDTNSAFLSHELAGIGISVHHHSTVGDNRERIIEAIRDSASRADLVITTGGLGPTSDDLTMSCLAELAGREMVEYPEAREHVERIILGRGYRLGQSNYKQAFFPEGSELIPNPGGTAMGALLEVDGTLFATLPGVPPEMREMFEESLEPLVRSRSEESIVSRSLVFAGIGESSLAERVQDLLDSENPTVAPLAHGDRASLRITARAKSEEAARDKIGPVAEEILSRLGDYYLGEGDETLEGAIGKLLSEKGQTLALAESCTGGLMAERLTDAPGASGYFTEALITYSDGSKERLLGVPRGMIEEHGAVSREVAEAMARGVREGAETDYGVSVTGIAGPEGGTPEKPVGLVWVGISDAGETVAEKLDLSGWAGSRENVRRKSADRAFNLLRKRILAA